jgi:hypothetical protein
VAARNRNFPHRIPYWDRMGKKWLQPHRPEDPVLAAPGPNAIRFAAPNIWWYNYVCHMVESIENRFEQGFPAACDAAGGIDAHRLGLACQPAVAGERAAFWSARPRAGPRTCGAPQDGSAWHSFGSGPRHEWRAIALAEGELDMDEGQNYTESAVLIGLIVLLIVGAIVLFPSEVENLIIKAESFLRNLGR